MFGSFWGFLGAALLPTRSHSAKTGQTRSHAAPHFVAPGVPGQNSIDTFTKLITPVLHFVAVKLYTIYISICLSIYLFIYLSIYLSIYPSISLSLYLSIYLSIDLSIHLSIYLYIYIFSIPCYSMLCLFLSLSNISNLYNISDLSNLSI